MIDSVKSALAELDHEVLMRQAIALSSSARSHGNKPFGALLTDLNGAVLLTSENTEYTDRDTTCHAEMNLMSLASQKLNMNQRSQSIMYASCEPCAMCAGAVFFAGVRAVVFGLSAECLSNNWVTDNQPAIPLLDIGCRDVFETCRSHETVVLGPILEDEALAPHIGFWD